MALLLPAVLLAGNDTVRDYQPIFRAVRLQGGSERVAIRSFRRGGSPSYLLVNPLTLETAIVPAERCVLHPAAAPAQLEATPYLRALERYTAPPYRQQNHGATRAGLPVAGVVLTVDLCPSVRPFERELFTRLGTLAAREGRPVPVAVAITGLWLERHGAELAWLQEEVKAGRLAITWVNHSDHHPFDPKLSLDKTFLLTAGCDPRQELLDLERKLLERGLLPSVFVRFPGLVADGRVIGTARELGLVPLGSDAWLAKGEAPRDGSFILVHGNGNEPRGITRFFDYLERRPATRFLPLAAAVTGEP